MANHDKYYALVGDEIVVCRNVEEWATMFGRKDRVIAADKMDEVTVSTVFLGLDHSFGEGEPVLFETMVFGGDYEGFCDRYKTKKDALYGHARVVKMVFGRNVLTEKIGKT